MIPRGYTTSALRERWPDLTETEEQTDTTINRTDWMRMRQPTWENHGNPHLLGNKMSISGRESPFSTITRSAPTPGRTFAECGITQLAHRRITRHCIKSRDRVQGMRSSFETHSTIDLTNSVVCVCRSPRSTAITECHSNEGLDHVLSMKKTCARAYFRFGPRKSRFAIFTFYHTTHGCASRYISARGRE